MLFVLGCSNPAPLPDAAPLVDDPAGVAASSEPQAPEPALRDAGSRTFASTPQPDGQGEVVMLLELRPLDVEQATRRGFAVEGRVTIEQQAEGIEVLFGGNHRFRRPSRATPSSR